MNKDLTTGKPEKVLWQFCLPLFGSIIFQQLYNIDDSFVAGKFISDNALAAVGNSYEITLIFIAFAFGCNIACSVIAALFFGAKQYEDLKTAVYTALIASSAVCILLMLVGMLCSDGLLRLIKTPDEVFADSKLPAGFSFLRGAPKPPLCKGRWHGEAVTKGLCGTHQKIGTRQCESIKSIPVA